VNEDGVDPRTAELDLVDDGAEVEVARVDGREGRRALEAGEDTEVEELVEREVHRLEEGGFGGEGHGLAVEVDVEDDAVESVKHEKLVGSIDRMDVGSLMAFEVCELSPGEVGRDNELSMALLELAVNEAKNVGGNDGTRRAKDRCRLSDPPLLVMLPRLSPLPVALIVG
jgi:hypothetical protein